MVLLVGGLSSPPLYQDGLHDLQTLSVRNAFYWDSVLFSRVKINIIGGGAQLHPSPLIPYVKFLGKTEVSFPTAKIPHYLTSSEKRLVSRCISAGSTRWQHGQRPQVSRREIY